MMPLLHVLGYIFATGLLVRTSLAIDWDCHFSPICGIGPAEAPGANQLSGCVSSCLQSAPVNYWSCVNVDCICPASHLPQAVAAITACATASCANDPGGLSLATNIALSYCQTWSQTAPPLAVGAATSTSTAMSITPLTTSNPVITSPTSTQMMLTTSGPTSLPTPTLGNPSSLFQVFSCAPCGKAKCSFAPSSNMSNAMYSLQVGTPISNCGQGSTGNITNTITGSLTLEDTWSVDSSVGLNLGFLKIDSVTGPTVTWSQTQSSTVEHSISIQVAPGQMGVMVAYVQYKRTGGSMQIDPVQGAVSLISNQPSMVVSYGQDIVQCGSSFSANDSQSFQCSSDGKSFGTWKFRAIFSLMLTLLSILWV